MSATRLEREFCAVSVQKNPLGALWKYEVAIYVVVFVFATPLILYAAFHLKSLL
jgi:hypothetical protein